MKLYLLLTLNQKLQLFNRFNSLLTESNDHRQEKGTWKLTKSQEGVFGVHEHQHSPEQVFVHDVGLDVVGMVLHTEGQKLQDQCKQLSCLEVVYTNKQQSYFIPGHNNHFLLNSTI